MDVQVKLGPIPLLVKVERDSGSFAFKNDPLKHLRVSEILYEPTGDDVSRFMTSRSLRDVCRVAREIAEKAWNDARDESMIAAGVGP